MIDQKEQQQILQTIKAICSAGHLTDEERDERRHLLFIGVSIALPGKLPPAWSINIQCGRTDRTMEELQ